MWEIEDDAVVLRTYKSGESDRVVVLWTREHGKVRVIAKGIRKTTSRLGGTLEALAYVHVDLVRTRGEFYIARHVEHRERLATLRSSYERINAGYAVVEVVDAIPSDDVADEGIFELGLDLQRNAVSSVLHGPVFVDPWKYSVGRRDLCRRDQWMDGSAWRKFCGCSCGRWHGGTKRHSFSIWFGVVYFDERQPR